jgi:hypothetical protein
MIRKINWRRLSASSRFLRYNDLTKIFHGTEHNAFQGDGFHLTPYGNESIADKYSKEIINLLTKE